MSYDLGELLLGATAQLAVFGLPTVLTLWLLRTRWLAHLPPLPRPARGWAQAGEGAVAAALALTLAIGVGALAGGFTPGPEWTAFAYEFAPSDFGRSMLLLILISVFEEALFRVLGLGLLAMLLLWLWDMLWLQRRAGFGQPARAERTAEQLALNLRGWRWAGLAATLLTSAAFGVAHLQNAHADWLGGANVTLAGVWLGLLFWTQRHVFGVLAAHFVWNALLVVLGLPVSGLAFVPPPFGLGFTGAREGLWSGGAFGPEAGLPCTLALLGLIAWTARGLHSGKVAAEE